MSAFHPKLIRVLPLNPVTGGDAELGGAAAGEFQHGLDRVTRSDGLLRQRHGRRFGRPGR
jgi:hypothetical protein